VCCLERKEGLVVGAAVGLVFYTLALIVLGPTVVTALTGNRNVSNTGSIKAVGVGVYSDQACTNPVSSLSWGVLNPGSSANKTVYIRNESNVAATLSKTQSNWNPSNASNYITLTWNYNGQTLSANQVVPAQFTLSVASNIAGITSFSFDITLTASG